MLIRLRDFLKASDLSLKFLVSLFFSVLVNQVNLNVNAYINTFKNLLCAEDEKKQEIQIGGPTDVKHVAHMGCDGSAEESPSWVWLMFLTFIDHHGAIFLFVK